MIGASTINTSGHIRYEEQSITDTWIRGLTPSMAPILDLDLTSGRMLDENDEENRSQVGVIGTDIVDDIFPTVDPLGKEFVSRAKCTGSLAWARSREPRWARAATTTWLSRSPHI